MPGPGLNCRVLCPVVNRLVKLDTGLSRSNCSPSPFQYFNYGMNEMQA